MRILNSLFLLLLAWPLWAADNEDSPDDIAAITEPAVAGDDTQAPLPQVEDASLLEDALTAGPVLRVQPNPSQRRIEEVVSYLRLTDRENELIKISDDESTLSGVYLAENTGTPQGGILILHDIDQHTLWPQTIAPLREYLPDYGWNTLSLFFGSYIQAPLPKIPEIEVAQTETDIPGTDSAEEEPEQAEQTAADESAAPFDIPIEDNNEEIEAIDQNFAANDGDELSDIAQNTDFFEKPNTDLEEPAAEQTVSLIEDDFLQTMFARVEDGLRQLNTLGQFNLVIIAHGQSANWAVETINQRLNKNPKALGYALILVNAKPSKYPSYELNEQLAKLKIPMLDIYTGQSEHEIRHAINRRNTVVRNQNEKYMQIKLPPVKSNLLGKQNVVSRRIRGWLKTHAAGQEVDVTVRD